MQVSSNVVENLDIIFIILFVLLILLLLLHILMTTVKNNIIFTYAVHSSGNIRIKNNNWDL